MATNALSRPTLMPLVFEDFFKPWNQWFDDSSLVRRVTNLPAVNITENEDHYTVALAAPGLKKDDFKIDIDGNIINISSEKEETKEQEDKKYNRKEYSYTSFQRSFTMPEDVKQDAIDARYQDGVLTVTLPRTEAKKLTVAKTITVK